MPPFALAAALAALTVWLGYFVRRDQFGQLAIGWLAFFPLIHFVKKGATTAQTVRQWLLFGIFLRFLLLFSWPNLSDDFWRFIWDGRLWLAGQHPFSHPPSFFFEHNNFPPGLSAELFEKLNSKNFHTVYPPVCQAVFAGAAFFGKNSDHAAVFLMKLFLFACECGTLFLLNKMAAPSTSRAAGAAHSALSIHHSPLIYALCPLPIFEVVGNCHFEGAMLFFMLAGLAPPSPPGGGEPRPRTSAQTGNGPFAAMRGVAARPLRGGWAGLGWAGLFFALSVAVKLLPLMFLPLLLPVFGLKKWAKFTGWLALFSLLLWLPMLDWEALKNMSSSLGLYFRAFEFNASFYYLLKPLARNPEGFDRPELLGPLLAGLAALTVLGLAAALYFKKTKAATAFLAASMAQLLLASTVHPWYVLTPFMLCFFTKWRFPVAWAAVAVLSYSHYLQRPFHERFEIIGLEYAIPLFYFLWEMGRRYFLEKTAFE